MGNWKRITSQYSQGFEGCWWKEFIWKRKEVCLGYIFVYM